MRVLVGPRAQKDLQLLDPTVAARVGGGIDALIEDPRPPGCRMLRGVKPSAWRVRVGDWPIIYRIDDAAGVVVVTRVVHRSKLHEL